MRQPNLVSVVITSYTMERFTDLCELLDSLAQQTYRNFEVIIVLEKSREHHNHISEYIKQKDYAAMRLLWNSGPAGLSAARNLGVKESKGEIIAFIDDDALASPQWLEAMVNTFENDSVIGLTGPAAPLWESETLKWIPEEFYWIVSCMSMKTSVPITVRNVWGTNMAFLRGVFEECGCFQESLGIKSSDSKSWNAPGAEDTEFSIRITQKMGGRIVYHPEVSVKHKVYSYRLSWRFIARRSMWEGCSKAMLKRLAKNNGVGALESETRLLKQILFKLISRTLVGFARNPADSWRRMSLITVVLPCVAFGYLRGTVRRLETADQKNLVATEPVLERNL